MTSRGSRFPVQAIVVLGLFCFLLSVVGSPAAAAEPPIKVGFIISLTGPVSPTTVPAHDALMAMVDDINRKGGVLGRQLQVIVADDRSDSTDAVKLATKLIKDDKVAAIIGPVFPDASMGVIPIVEREHVPIIITGPLLAPFKKWVFATGPGDAKAVAAYLQFACRDLGAKRIAIFADSSAAGTFGVGILKKELPKYPGVNFIIEEKFEPYDSNMIPQLTKIKKAKPDLVLLYGVGLACASVAKQYKQLGMTTPLLAGGGVGNPHFMSVAKKEAEENKWIFQQKKMGIAEKLPMSDPFRKDIYEPFKKIYQGKYGADKMPTTFMALTADAPSILVEALKKAGTDDRAALRDALEKVEYSGVGGTFAPHPDDHFGGAKDDSALAVLKSGEMVPYSK